jgi:hypothetical protein
MVPRICILVLLVAPYSVSARATGSLCEAKELVVSSCQTKAGKFISFCASRNLGPATGYMQYRFGTESKVELQYPERQVHPRGLFTWDSVPYSRGSAWQLIFANGSFVYVLYSELTGESPPGFGHTKSSGVYVLNRNAKSSDGGWPKSALVANIKCAGPDIGRGIPDGTVDRGEFVNLE